MSKRIISDIVKKIKPIEVKKSSAVKTIKTPKLPWLKLFLGIVFVIIFLLVINFFMGVFSSASVKAVPVQEFADIDLNLKGSRDSNSKNLPFEIVQVDHQETQKIISTGAQTNGQKAKGQIVVYNTFSSASQTLIKNTRFEAPDGKIYRTEKTIVVPVNGSIEATVYADKAGEDYNIGLTDFFIPAFKEQGDTERFKKIYGRSKTSMTGGSSGTSYVLTEEDIMKAKNELEGRIKNYLMEMISKEKPVDYVFFQNGIVVDFDDIGNNPKPGDQGREFDYGEKGTATGFLLKKEELDNEIIGSYLNVNLAGKVSVINLDKLEFKLLNSNKENTEINFNLKGRAHFVWKTDADALISDLMKMNADGDYNLVFKKYPGIESAEIVFKPSWWRYIPKKQNRIHLEIILKNE